MLKAPNGDAIQGTSELVPGTAYATFTSATEYSHDGETGMSWDAAETQTIDGVPLFTDESGVEWLLHHLIPEKVEEPLSQKAIDAFAREEGVGRLLDALRAAEAAAQAASISLVLTHGAVERVAKMHRELKARSIAIRDEEVAKQLEEGNA